MANTASEQIRECLALVDECARKAAAQTDPTLKQDFLDVGCRWLALARSYHTTEHLPDFADHLGRTRWLIDEGRLSQATVRNEKIGDAKLLASSRADIAESKRLLVTTDRPVIARRDPSHFEADGIPGLAIELPSSERTDQNPATLTINVFQEDGRFGWTVYQRMTQELLGRGVARTELKARADALGAGMTFIERLRCSRRTYTRIH